MKKRKIFKWVFLTTIILALAASGAGLTYFTKNEYIPEDTQSVAATGSKTKRVYAGDTITAVTYSVGYGIHDSSYDCVFEGGKTGKASDQATVESNIDAVVTNIKALNPDVILLQEVDRSSARSYNLDEPEMIKTGLKMYNSVFAENHVCKYHPTGLSGKINSGIQTLSKLHYLDTAERISLPDSDKWPYKTVSMKECMLVQRVEVEDSTKQLVIINVHLTESEMNLDQYKELAKFMQLEFAKGNYVIAGGNFSAMLPSVRADKYPENDDGGFYPTQLPMNVLTGGWKYCTDDSLPSARRCDKAYNSNEDNAQVYVTDGLITSPNTLISDVKTIDTQFEACAHNPISVKVTFVK